MEGFFASLVKGLITMIAQQQLNNYAMDRQNSYNERMFNQYGRPMSQASEMRMAGMSDAGIGAALSGYSGAGTTLQSAPLETAQFGDLFADMGQLLQNQKTGTEIKLNEIGAKQAKQNLQKGLVEIRMLKVQHNISQNQYSLLRNTFNNMIRLSDAELQTKLAELEKLRTDIITSRYQQNVAKYESDLANFKSEFMRITGVTWDDVKTKDFYELFDLALKLIGGTQIDDKDVFKRYNFDDSWPSVPVYGDNLFYYK